MLKEQQNKKTDYFLLVLFKYKFDYWEMLSQESIHILPEEGMILHSDTHKQTHTNTQCVCTCACVSGWMQRFTYSTSNMHFFTC